VLKPLLVEKLFVGIRIAFFKSGFNFFGRLSTMLIVMMIGLPRTIVKALGTKIIGLTCVKVCLINVSRMFRNTKSWWGFVISMTFAQIVGCTAM